MSDLNKLWDESKVKVELIKNIDIEIKKVSDQIEDIEDKIDIFTHGDDREDWLKLNGYLAGLQKARDIIEYGVFYLE